MNSRYRLLVLVLVPLTMVFGYAIAFNISPPQFYINVVIPAPPFKTNTATPTPSIDIDLHKEWFKARYDSVNGNTIFVTKDNYGPGQLVKNPDGDIIKLSFGATIPGTIFDINSPMTVTLSINRMAGGAIKGAVGNEDWIPMRGTKVQVWETCASIILYPLNGEKIQMDPTKVDYVLSTTIGAGGEKFEWETLTVTGDLKILTQLQWGGKIAVCDSVMTLQKDQLSQIWSLLARLNAMGPMQASN
jgi:hypothetical protein